MRIESSKRLDHEGHSYEVLQGTYGAKDLGGPFRDFEVVNSKETICVTLLRCYGEDASWCDKTETQLTVGLISELSKKFQDFSFLVKTKMGILEIPAGADAFEIQEIILNFIIRKASL